MRPHVLCLMPVASHGYRWIDYQLMGEDAEREHIRKAVEITTRVCGTRPLGLYQVGGALPRTRRKGRGEV